MIAAARAFQWPAATAMLAQTVPVENLTNAVSWNGTARETATMAGPALAGLMIAAFGSESVYLAQAIMAIAAAVSFSMIQLAPRPVEERPAPGLKSTIDGLKFVWADKIILSALCLDTFAVLFGGETALLPIFAEEILKVGPTGLGWLRAAPAVGAGLMSLYLAHRSTIHRAGHVLLGSVALFGVAIIGFALATNPFVSFGMLFFVGAFDAISVVLRISVVQMRTPDHLRGRVSAVNALFISSSNQWGAVESGLAAELMGVVPAVVFGGTMTIVVVAAIAWMSKSLRNWKN
jgi:MFS family permease